MQSIEHEIRTASSDSQLSQMRRYGARNTPNRGLAREPYADERTGRSCDCWIVLCSCFSGEWPFGPSVTLNFKMLSESRWYFQGYLYDRRTLDRPNATSLRKGRFARRNRKLVSPRRILCSDSSISQYIWALLRSTPLRTTKYSLGAMQSNESDVELAPCRPSVPWTSRSHPGYAVAGAEISPARMHSRAVCL